MNAKAAILAHAAKRGVITSAEIVRLLGVSRQAAARHLRELVHLKKLVKLGSTKLARYFPPSARHVPPRVRPLRYRARHLLKGLQEDAVLREIEWRSGFPRRVSPRARGIVSYAFTEMLNNAIEHSKSKIALVDFRVDDSSLRFSVRDYGIGVYENVRSKFSLQGHPEAAEHLLKGRQTTAPKGHTGQGIFFTSKISDGFVLESAELKLVVDNRIEDLALKDIPRLKGTRVEFVINKNTRKDLKKLFNEYSNSDYEFDKTKMMVHLMNRRNEFVSRSQARSLLFGLERFGRITLDFRRVTGIGQGFADEIFRVFKNRHPGIEIEALNTSASVSFMIQRARREREGARR